MIISFTDKGVNSTIWPMLLFRLKMDSPAHLFNDHFYTWLEEEWAIKAITEKQIESAPILVGLEMPEAVYTMLMLRYK